MPYPSSLQFSNFMSVPGLFQLIVASPNAAILYTNNRVDSLVEAVVETGLCVVLGLVLIFRPNDWKAETG